MASNFRTDLKVFIDVNLSPAARSQALATTAIAERDKLIASGRASKSYVTSVDGRKGAAESSVKGTGGGIINYHFSFIGDAVEFALSFLRTRVPKVGGSRSQFLSQSFWVSVNDNYIPPGTAINYGDIPSDAQIVIGNTAAYWRKADLNLRGRTALRYRAPHELDDCVSAIRREFGRSAISAKRVYDYQFPNKYKPVLSRSRKPYTYNSPVIIISEVQ